MTTFSLRQWDSRANPHFKNKPCYWSVFNHETSQSAVFYYKHDALVYRQLLPHATVYFHWYEEEFSRLDVSIEPSESHDKLCRQRAQELRDTYKYLRLWFSGGADSQTALDSFVNNNIFLDEIVVAEHLDGDNNQDITTSTKREIVLAAMPALKKIAHLIPNTKIRVIKATVNDADEWFNGSDQTTNMSLFDSMDGDLTFALDSAWAFSKLNQETTLDDFCDISGGSKVKLFRNKDRWYFYWADSSLGNMYNSNHCEDFFISRTIPNLYLKTVYMLKQFFINQKFTDNQINDFYTDVKMNREYNLAMGRSWVPDISTFKLYLVTHDPALWQDKFISGWNSQAFYKNTINTEQGQRWKKNFDNSVRAALSIAKDQWNLDSMGNPVPSLGRKGHLSKFYCLNDGRAYDSVDAKK